MNLIHQKYQPYLFIAIGIICSILLRWHALHSDLSGIHLWRQTQTQWNIINFCHFDANIFFPRAAMLNEDFDNVLLLEFPLLQWLIAMILNIHGDCNNIILTRYCLCLVSIISIIGFYKWVQLLVRDQWTSLITVQCFMLCPLLYYYSINPLPDNLALCMGLWYLFFITLYERSARLYHLIWAVMCLSISVLAKLPFITFIGYGLLLLHQCRNLRSFGLLMIAHLMGLLAPILWYMRSTQTWDAEGPLVGIFGQGIDWPQAWTIVNYHLTTGLLRHYVGPGILIFLIVGMCLTVVHYKKNTATKIGLLGFAISTLSYFIYELNVIDTIHDYYMYPFLPLLFIIVAYGIRWLRSMMKPILFLSMVTMGIVSQMIYNFRTTNQRWTTEQSYINPAIFECHEEFIQGMTLPGHVIYLNDGSGVIYSYFFKRWGYMFYSDYLPAAWVDHMIAQGDAMYMISDSRAIDESHAHQQYYEQVLQICGDMKLIKLQSQ